MDVNSGSSDIHSLARFTIPRLQCSPCAGVNEQPISIAGQKPDRMRQ
jgi:hypothetical protein